MSYITRPHYYEINNYLSLSNTKFFRKIFTVESLDLHLNNNSQVLYWRSPLRTEKYTQYLDTHHNYRITAVVIGPPRKFQVSRPIYIKFDCQIFLALDHVYTVILIRKTKKCPHPCKTSFSVFHLRAETENPYSHITDMRPKAKFIKHLNQNNLLFGWSML